MNLVGRNWDKPHRCPNCHTIPLAAYRRRRQMWWTIYKCPFYCNCWWFPNPPGSSLVLRIQMWRWRRSL